MPAPFLRREKASVVERTRSLTRASSTCPKIPIRIRIATTPATVNHAINSFSKKKLSSAVSNSRIDRYYEAARKAGAIGGKLCGAGTSGFILLYVEPGNAEKVRGALSRLPEVEFSFENEGSTIIFRRTCEALLNQ